MKKRYLIGLIASILTGQSSASVFMGEIRFDDIKWNSIQNVSSGYITPSTWDLAINIPPANKVIPSAPLTKSINLVISGNGKNITIPISVEGIQYKLYDTKRPSDHSGATTTHNGDIVTVKGTGIGNKIYTFDKNVTPFTHFRPIIAPLSGADLISKFEEARMNLGTYRGYANIVVPYQYYRDDIKIQSSINVPVELSIKYNNTSIKTTSVTGSNIIKPVYYGYPDVKVRGETTYEVSIGGHFPNGLTMKLKDSLSSEVFSMDYEGSKINYNLECKTGCKTDSQLIIDGVSQVKGKKIELNTSEGENSRVALNVNFRDKNLAELESATYRGQFTVLFETKGI